MARPPDTVGQIEVGLSSLMRQVASPRLQERLAARTGVRLERAAYQVLVRIEDEGPTGISAMADGLCLDVSTVSRQVRHLADLGLVKKFADEQDGRAAVVQMSANGRTVLTRGREVRRGVVEAILADWSENQRQLLARHLDRLVTDLERFVAVQGEY